MRFTRHAAPLALSIVLLAACAEATPTATPPAAQPTIASSPTVAPTKPAEVTKPTAAATKPAEATKPAAVSTKPAVPASDATKPAAASARTITLTDESSATVRVQEQFANIDAPNDAVLRTEQVSGSITLGPDGNVMSESSKLTADLTSLQSDQSRRDNYVKSNTLEVRQFPTADFVPTEIRGLPSPLPTSGQFQGQMLGTMTIHGVSRPVTFDFSGTVQNGTATGKATTEFKLTDFGMEIPRVASIISIEDLVRLEVDFTARS